MVTGYFSGRKGNNGTYGWTLKILCSVKEASHKRLHIIWFHFNEMSRTVNSILAESRLVVARRKEGVGWGVTANGMMFLLGMMKICWNYIVVIVVRLYEYMKNHELYTLKRWILWHVNYHTAIKQLFSKQMNKKYCE